MFRHQSALFREFINNKVQNVLQELVVLISIKKLFLNVKILGYSR